MQNRSVAACNEAEEHCGCSSKVKFKDLEKCSEPYWLSCLGMINDIYFLDQQCLGVIMSGNFGNQDVEWSFQCFHAFSCRCHREKMGWIVFSFGARGTWTSYCQQRLAGLDFKHLCHINT